MSDPNHNSRSTDNPNRPYTDNAGRWEEQRQAAIQTKKQQDFYDQHNLAQIGKGTSGTPGGGYSGSGATGGGLVVVVILGFLAVTFFRTGPPSTPSADHAGQRERVPPVAPAPPPRQQPLAIPRQLTFAAKHKHRLQDCEGVLIFSADNIRYRTEHPEDSFAYNIAEVELHDDGFRDPSGKAWHFTAAGRDIGDLFRRWKAGHLLIEEPAASSAPIPVESPSSAAPIAIESEAPVSTPAPERSSFPAATTNVPPPRIERGPDTHEARISAKHKHRLRDCEGVLIFSTDAVRFDSAEPEDSFVYSIHDVELREDGFRDRAGKTWHFTAAGRDMRDTFRRWKAGVLPTSTP